ncbi:mechanosensitive ion channel protein 1, mitochondrial-like [Gastrolobium bilobum]|uniref:mechanosensitive ion channel protein 1, mitochondrial-like n=1 Tax=Gastrolobium bilobum TaxID=150636 RepID=UPI002AB2F5DA|nr:mechanosensitive ion channel protein 1, mitochondrial-like [Gastrolobium bilobum]
MAAISFFSLRRLQSSINLSLNMELANYSVAMNLTRISQNRFSNLASNASLYPRFSSFCFRSTLPFASNVLNSRTYSSSVGVKGSGTEVVPGSGSGDSVVTGDWAEKIEDIWKSEVETTYAQPFDSHLYLNNVVIPVGGTLIATMIAWFLLPRVLRKFHKYAMQGPVSPFPGGMSVETVPYEKSFWGSMEDPVRYLVTFMAFSQIGVMVAPTTLAAQYLLPAWRGEGILSFLWFLHRWKANVFERTIQSLPGLREKLLPLHKISSIGLFVIGIMALPEPSAVAVHSIVAVGRVGGVTTAFVATDIFRDVFGGLYLQFSKPFSTGDIIQAGSIEGQVVEMGLTTTSLRTSEKFPVIVPNSFFTSQPIVNESRAECRAIITIIPMQTVDLSKIPQISDDVESMLRSNAKVFLGKDVPSCCLSCKGLTLRYNLKRMCKDELYSAGQEILLQAVHIIKNNGCEPLKHMARHLYQVT